MRDAASYRGNRRNFFRIAMGSIRHWRTGTFHAVAMNPMKQRRRTIVHATFTQTR